MPPLRAARRPLTCVLAAWVCMAFIGCVGYREFLDRPLPESSILAYPPARVWDAARAEAAQHAGRVLVEDPQEHILSWISEIEKDSPLHASLADPKLGSRGGRRMAITLVHLQAVPGGCRMVIRQNYFPVARKSHGPSPSRGTFEEALSSRIRRRLAAGG